MAPVARIHDTTSKGLRLLSKAPNSLLSLAEKSGFYGVEDFAAIGTTLKGGLCFFPGLCEIIEDFTEAAYESSTGSKIFKKLFSGASIK